MRLSMIWRIGHFHNNDIWLQLPESISCQSCWGLKNNSSHLHKKATNWKKSGTECCVVVVKWYHHAIVLLCRLRRLLPTEAKAKVDNSLRDLHNIILHIIWKQNSTIILLFIHFLGEHNPKPPLVWSTFGTPAFISAQTPSKLHATPLKDLCEFAMNNRYQGNLDWVLI